MKKYLFLILAMFSINLMAEKYTIVFNSNENGDGSTPKNPKISDYVLTATNNCVDSLIFASKVARAKPGFGIKGGTSGEKGELAFRLDDTYHISAMTVYAATYPHAKDTAATRGFIVCGHSFKWEAGHRTEIRPYSMTLDKDLDSISIAAEIASYNRWYVQKIEFEAENPHPTQSVIEMPYAALNLGAVGWESADIPMEDAIDFEIYGKNINGNISLSFKNGNSSKFTLTPKSLPANGGEVSVSYSISMSAAPANAITYKDTVIATATGNDAVKRTRKLPVELTIKPEGKGASTFDIDTTCIVIGPMPGDYYKDAQNTSDSTLKNHLGTIICCGRRYRYGSGAKHSWDGFFYTDRDTVTNQVLDMYSNNVRYFNPESPTASVADFDIEHMLPKSWWGGDVNPAYCDLFHLVPGDASANRSKSNHAPGIPADSSFNNGSFVTGRDTVHGLQRVFCPENQYKGDFARAYFYIATCYGDSLTWLTSGEPASAMTNDGWEEFRPWLRDLLLEWHRMDPVSEKEKTRAIEVNKIQGNRNPFIDFPELVEYIWGNKKGEVVNFYDLEQSYGDPYDETQDIINPTDEKGTTRKEIKDGQVVIIRNTSSFTVLGQPVK